jgi:hypothetical protein
MLPTKRKLLDRISAHWFYAAFIILTTLAFAFGRIGSFPSPSLEAATLSVLVVIPPSLFLACYRERMNRRQLAVGSLAASCTGLFIAGWAVPASSQHILPHLGWARTSGLVLIALIEVGVLYRLIRLLFQGNPTAEQLSKASGAPPWLAYIMLLEATFWKAVWHFLRRGAGAADREQ